MTSDEIFPSRYLKAADLPEEGAIPFTIDKVTVEQIGKEKDRMPIIHFVDHDKSLVCNKTNWNMIVKVTGIDDSDEWSGQKIMMGRSDVEAFGEMVEAIRVRPPKAKRMSSSIDNDKKPKAAEAELDENGVPF